MISLESGSLKIKDGHVVIYKQISKYCGKLKLKVDDNSLDLKNSNPNGYSGRFNQAIT